MNNSFYRLPLGNGFHSFHQLDWFPTEGWRNGKNQKPTGPSVALTFPNEAMSIFPTKASGQPDRSKQRPSVTKLDFLERL